MRTRLYLVLSFAVIALLGCPSDDDGSSGEDDGAAGSQAAGSGGKPAASAGAGGSSAAPGGAGNSTSEMDASVSSGDKDAAAEIDAATASPDQDASTGSGEGVSEQCKTCLRANQQGCAGVLLGCEMPSPCAMCLDDAYGPGITGLPGSCKDTPVFTMLGGCACMYCAEDCNTECTTFWKQPS